MRLIPRLTGAAALLLAGIALSPTLASAHQQTIVAYDRATDGTLREAGSYATGGRGGVLAGSVVDHLASQSSLAYDADAQLLYAVNAGSDTITVFAVHGDRATRLDASGLASIARASRSMSFEVTVSTRRLPMAGET